MGAVNYGRNQYFNIGYCTEYIVNHESAEEEQLLIECEAENVQSIIDDFSFNFFEVEIKSGNYIGFYLNISTNEKLDLSVDYFLDSTEKKMMLADIQLLKKMLLKLLKGTALTQYSSGWCTVYFDRRQSIFNLNESFAELRNKALNIPCYRAFKKLKNKGE